MHEVYYGDTLLGYRFECIWAGGLRNTYLAKDTDLFEEGMKEVNGDREMTYEESVDAREIGVDGRIQVNSPNLADAVDA